MTEAELVDIGQVRDLYRLLEAIDDIFSGHEAVLCLEASGFASAVESFLHDHAMRRDLSEVTHQTLLPASRIYCLSLREAFVREFIELSKNFAEPEVAEHLSVSEGGVTVLSAPDAGFGHVFVAGPYVAEVRQELAERRP